MTDADRSLETELLSVARRCAEAAGHELMSRWRGPLEISTKSTPTDPVSEADVAGETAIREILARERPGDAILGEEGGETGGDGSAADGRGLRWVIDPLDGTVNYLYGLPAFVVSVAVEDADGGLAAVINDPVRGDLYLATRSGSPRRERADGSETETLVASTCDRLDRALVATGFAYDPAVRAAQGRMVAEVLARSRDIRRPGAAALDLALLAGGRVDAYYERGVKAWDIGAGALLCQRAGLVVRELDESIDPVSGITLPTGLVVAPPGLIDELYTLVAGAHHAR